MSILQDESRPILRDIVVSQEESPTASQAKTLLLTRTDSASKRQSIQSSTLETQSSADLSSRAIRSVKRRSSYGTTRLERGEQESIRELAAFFKNQEPPPSSYMSIPDSIDTTTQVRKLPFKMFRRQNSKRGLANSRTLRLPDSAVASKTTSGKWHIAISIPLEHDYLEEPREIHEISPTETDGQPIIGTRNGPITVLKPVIESKELPKPYRADSVVGPSGMTSSSPLKNESFLSPIDAEDTRALQNYYRQQSIQDLASKFEDSTANVARRAPLTKDFVTATAVDSRRYSQVTDNRQSGGTLYSDVSLNTDRGHSRGPSSASSAPSAKHFISLKTIERGNRLSSNTKREHLVSSVGASTPVRSPSSASTNPRNSVIVQDSPSVASVDSDLSSAQLCKGDMARGYCTFDIAGVNVTAIRNVARMPGPAPTRKLPDLPEGSDDGRSKPRSTRGSTRQIKRSLPNKGTDSEAATLGSEVTSLSSSTEIGKTMRQLRQEKVKALRSRDMAALKAKTNYPQAIAANLAKGNKIAVDTSKTIKISRATAPGRHSRRKSLSTGQQELGHHQMTSSLTPVMVVANIEPPFDEFYFPSPPRSPPRSSPKKNSKKTGRSDSFGRAPTPPRSLTPSLASSDDEGMHLPRRCSTVRSSITHHSNQSGSGRLMSNSSRDEEIEARIRRLERSNAMMMQTLSAVMQMGVGFRELQKLLPLDSAIIKGEDMRAGLRNRRSLQDGLQMRNRRSWDGRTEALERGLVETIGRGVEELEPLMRELQSAVRVSEEAVRVE